MGIHWLPLLKVKFINQVSLFGWSCWRKLALHHVTQKQLCVKRHKLKFRLSDCPHFVEPIEFVIQTRATALSLDYIKITHSTPGVISEEILPRRSWISVCSSNFDLTRFFCSYLSTITSRLIISKWDLLEGPYLQALYLSPIKFRDLHNKYGKFWIRQK